MGLLQSIEFKVGLMVVVVASLIAFMSMQVSEDPSYMGRSQLAWFLINDAGGLVQNSSVKMAGIPMGIIKSIRYQDGRARIDMVIKSDVKLSLSAAVDIRAIGILGDKYIEISPGSPTDPPLPNGGQILNVKDRGSMDSLISRVGEITNSLANVSKILQESVQDEGSRKHVLGRIVSNIEKITSDLAEVTDDNKDKIDVIISQVSRVTKSIDTLVNDPGEEGFKESWKKAVASLKRIDSSLKNIEEITDKVNSGKGTIGKLVNDESTVEELSTAIQGVSSMVDSVNRISTTLDFHSEYLGNSSDYKSYAGIKIQPGLDRYYLIEIVDDPDGLYETTETKTTVTGGAVADVKEVKKHRNKTKLTVQLAKNFYDFSVRGGIIENSGGLGFDYYLLRNKLKLSMDLFQFSTLNIRTYAQYQIWRGLYVVGGVNDALNKSNKYSNYLGLGLSLTNDDLKMFASRVTF
jgi:phospholipid/cholesterol/gamma-HCH transport system substrate-binding protein